MILAITSVPPNSVTPPQNGLSVYILSMLNALLEIGEVTLLTPEPPRGLVNRADRLTVEVTPEPAAPGFLGRHLRSVRAGASPEYWAHQAPGVYRFLSTCTPLDYEACIALEERAAIYLPALPPWLPTLLVRGNMLGHVGGWPSTSHSPVSLLRNRYHVWLGRRFNVWTSRHADAVLTVTARGLDVVRRIAPETPTLLLPPTRVTLPHRVQSRAAARAATADPLTAVFVGNYAYPPNAQAVQWFVHAVLPKLPPHLLSHFVFRFIGDAAPVEIARAAPEGAQIEFPGFVNDLEAELADADIGIVPLQHGDGVKTKTLAMLGAGLPIVSTSIGVEGLPSGACVLADGADAFAIGLGLMRNPSVRTRLARAAIAAVQEHAASVRPEEVLREAIRLASERHRSRRRAD